MASLFRAALDELESIVEGRSRRTTDLAGQLALREAWWRAPIELGRVLTASSFALWEVPSPGPFHHTPPGPVQRALRDSRIISHQTSKRLLDAVERERKVSDEACPRPKPPAPKHGVVVVSGADAHPVTMLDGTRPALRLPKGACKPAACDDVRAQLGGAKGVGEALVVPARVRRDLFPSAALGCVGIEELRVREAVLADLSSCTGRARSLRDQPRRALARLVGSLRRPTRRRLT